MVRRLVSLVASLVVALALGAHARVDHLGEQSTGGARTKHGATAHDTCTRANHGGCSKEAGRDAPPAVVAGLAAASITVPAVHGAIELPSASDVKAFARRAGLPSRDFKHPHDPSYLRAFVLLI